MLGQWPACGYLCFYCFCRHDCRRSSYRQSTDNSVGLEKHTALYFDLSGEITERNQPANFMQMIQRAENKAPHSKICSEH